MNKVEVFKVEFGYINDERYAIDAKYLVDSLPDYFFEHVVLIFHFTTIISHKHLFS